MKILQYKMKILPLKNDDVGATRCGAGLPFLLRWGRSDTCTGASELAADLGGGAYAQAVSTGRQLSVLVPPRLTLTSRAVSEDCFGGCLAAEGSSDDTVIIGLYDIGLYGIGLYDIGLYDSDDTVNHTGQGGPNII